MLCLASSPPGHASYVDALSRQAIEEAIWQRGSAQAANNLRRVQAVWLGMDEGCDIVAVESSERPGVYYSYRACGGEIRDVGDVPPAAPEKDVSYRKSIEDAARRALTYGAATDWYAGYRLRARRVGVPRADGCALVEMIVSHGPHLVDRRISPACP